MSQMIMYRQNVIREWSRYSLLTHKQEHQLTFLLLAIIQSKGIIPVFSSLCNLSTLLYKLRILKTSCRKIIRYRSTLDSKISKKDHQNWSLAGLHQRFYSPHPFLHKYQKEWSRNIICKENHQKMTQVIKIFRILTNLLYQANNH